MHTASTRMMQRPLLTAVVVAATAFAVASCGDDDNSTGESAKNTAARTANGDSWSDYMVLRNGYTCTASAKVSGLESVGTTVTRDVERHDGLVSFAIATTSSVKGTTTPPMTITTRYAEQPDGALKVSMPTPNIPGFTTKVEGDAQMPSIAALRKGRTETGHMTMTMTPVGAAAREQLKPLLSNGAGGIQMELTLRIGAAPVKRELRTNGKTYTDLVGVKNEYVSAKITNVKDETLSTAFKQIADSFLKNTTESYYARGVGQVQTVAAGVPVTVTRCKG